MSEKAYHLIETGWQLYISKVAGYLLEPENEKMMQLQLALILQSLGSLYESRAGESIKILLEVPVDARKDKRNIIDIVVRHSVGESSINIPIELKCFRLMTRSGKAKRGGGNLMMYDYWEDIENIELYSCLKGYSAGIHLALTDDPYLVEKEHKGKQVKVYSTSELRGVVSGKLEKEIKNRKGRISLDGHYDMSLWRKSGDFYHIKQRANTIMLET